MNGLADQRRVSSVACLWWAACSVATDSARLSAAAARSTACSAGSSVTLGLPVVGDVTSLLSLDAIAPALNPATTVDGLLKSLQDGDLIRVDLGVATARNAGDLQSYISQAVSEGGAIDILPNLLGRVSRSSRSTS